MTCLGFCALLEPAEWLSMGLRVLVTGAVGLAGVLPTHRLLNRGDDVVGIDNLNPYYDPKLKAARIERLSSEDRFEFIQMTVPTETDGESVQHGKFDTVVHRRRQACGTHSTTRLPISKRISTDSRRCWKAAGTMASNTWCTPPAPVYGSNQNLPFSVGDNVDHPISLYAATKKSNEHMAHVYAHLRRAVYGLVTVYGPWGRPDMLFRFVESILKNEPIPVYGNGEQTGLHPHR